MSDPKRPSDPTDPTASTADPDQPSPRPDETLRVGPEAVVGRRAFLGIAAAAVPSLAAACGDDNVGGGGTDGMMGDGDGDGDDGGEETPFDPGGIVEDPTQFPRTVIAGEMKPRSVMLAVYVADALPKVLRVWRTSATPGNVILVKDLEVVPDTNGFVKVSVDGLIPGTWYDYGFFEEEGGGAFIGRSLLGRVRTALANGVSEPITFVISACNGGYYNPSSPPATPFTWAAMTVAAGIDYDLFLHLGDQAYLDEVYAQGGAYETYLEAWGAYHAGGYREVFPKAGLYAVWDDHEVTDNGDVDPWTMNATDVTKIENAIRAFYTVLPIDATDSFDPLWRSFRWGDTVEFIVLDSRYERAPRSAGEYLSAQQLAWFKDTLQNSPCQFKVVLNSVPFAVLTGWFGIQANDRWEGYGAQRQEVIDFIDTNNIQNVYWVAGDIHTCYVGDVQASPGAGPGSRGKEICVTSGNSNPVAGILNGSQFPWKSSGAHVPVITLDPLSNSLTVKFYGTDGTIEHEATFSP